MIDAYTIGITLALDDGVSAGIASIQRDISALDIVVSKGALQLQRLRELGQQVVTPLPVRLNEVLPDTTETSPSAPVRGREQTGRTGGERERDADPVSISRPPEPSPMSFATLVDRAGMRQDGYGQSNLTGARFPNVTATGFAETDSLPTAALNESSGVTLPGGPASRTNMSISEPWAFDRSVSPQATIDPNVGVYSPTGWSENRSTAALAPLSADVAGRGEILHVVQQPIAAPNDTWSGFAPPPPYIQEYPSWGKSSLVSGQDWLRPESRSAAAPGASSPLSLMGWTAAPGLQSARRTDAAASTSAGSESRQLGSSGALYLDGVSIGRWMFDQLGDQASRPHSGFSGIDPRLTPSFPGAPSDG